MIDPKELQRTSGCGVQGCLVGSVVLFVLLLIAMLFIAVGRFSAMPGGPQAPRSAAPAPDQESGLPPSLLYQMAVPAAPESHA